MRLEDYMKPNERALLDELDDVSVKARNLKSKERRRIMSACQDRKRRDEARKARDALKPN